LVTIQGDVVEFQFRAPHAWLYVTVRDAEGRAQRYGAEWSNPFRLERDGVSRDTLQAGDQVSITGSPGRDAEARQIHLKKVTRFSRGEWSWNAPKRGR
jgi:outer membrane usher protein FimD/PapC